MSCSIHLGNYILVVESAQQLADALNKTESNEASRPNSQQQQIKRSDTTVSQTTPQHRGPAPVGIQSRKNMGALDYELAWIRFLRDAEVEYIHRLTRGEKTQPLSVFEVSIDIFESYLLKVSGRALASTQHLNLSLISSMVSDMKIFDTQSPEGPTEEEQEQGEEDQLRKRRDLRMHHQNKKRSSVPASFQSQVSEPFPIFEDKTLTQQFVPNGIMDTLDVRDDLHNESEEDGGERFGLNTFDANNRDTIDEPVELAHHVIEVETSAKQSAPHSFRNMESFGMPQTYQHSLSGAHKEEVKQPVKNREFRISQLCPDSIIKSEDDLQSIKGQGEVHFNNSGRIKIGDQTIEDPAVFLNDNHIAVVGSVHDLFDQESYNEEPYIQDYQQMDHDQYDGANPFRQNSISFLNETASRKQSILSGTQLAQHVTLNQEPMLNLESATLEVPAFEEVNTPIVASEAPQQIESKEIQNHGLHEIEISNLDIPKVIHGIIDQLHDTKIHQTAANDTAEFPAEAQSLEKSIELATMQEADLKYVVAAIEDPPIIEETPVIIKEQKEIESHSQDIKVIETAVEVALEGGPEQQISTTESNGNYLAPTPPVIEEVKVIHQMEDHDQQIVSTTSLENQSNVLDRVKAEESIEIALQTDSLEAKTLQSAHAKVEVLVPHTEPLKEKNGVDAACGSSSPMNQSVTIEPNNRTSDKLDASIGARSDCINMEARLNDQSSIRHEVDNMLAGGSPSPMINNMSRHSASSQVWSKNQSRLEVTLTAEPDQPIIVKVQGGEKQFLISALTKHIYEILSQPQKGYTTMINDESVFQSKPAREEESIPTPPTQLQPRQLKLSKNMNLKLKSLKKALQSRSRQSESRSPLPVDNAIEVEEIDPSSRDSSQHLPTISKDITKLGDFASGSHQATSPFIANHEHTVNRGSGAAATPLQSNRREGSKNKPLEATYQVREISSQSDKKRGFDPEPVSKRTLTEEAYDDAKIREDEKLHQAFGSQRVSGITDQSRHRELLHDNRESDMFGCSKQPGNQHDENRIQYSLKGSLVLEDVRVHHHQENKSRPETATFTGEGALSTLTSPYGKHQELPPITRKSSQLSNRLSVHQAKRSENLEEGEDEDVVIRPIDVRKSRKALTPDVTSGPKERSSSVEPQFRMQQSPEEEVQQFTLPPLIPSEQAEDYFQIAPEGGQQNGEQEYMIADTNAQNYYDMYQYHNFPQGQQMMPQPYYITSQYQDHLGYNTVPVNNQSFSNGGEYILAEGYLLKYDKRGGGRPQIQPGTEVYQNPQIYSRNPLVHGGMIQHMAMTQQLDQQQQPFLGTQTLGTMSTNPTLTYQRQEFHTQQQSQDLHQRLIGKQLLSQQKKHKKPFSTYYSLNGGPKHRTASSTSPKSLSPQREKGKVFFTGEYQGIQTLISNCGNDEPGYLTQQYCPGKSPQRTSPYMRDDELRNLNSFYDVQCEPSGFQRGGVPLMRVKRINKAKQKPMSIFNFNQVQSHNRPVLPRDLEQAQFFYPQQQSPNISGSPFRHEHMSKTIVSPNKWFDRFNQSTRNLNDTIQKLQRQHSKKMRSYSTSTFSSNAQQETLGTTQSKDGVQSIYSREKKQQIQGSSDFTLEKPRLNQNATFGMRPQVQSAGTQVFKSKNSNKQGINGMTSPPPFSKSQSVMMHSSPAMKTSNQNIFLHDHSNPTPKHDRSLGTIKKNKLPPRPKGKNGGGAAPGIVAQVNAAT